MCQLARVHRPLRIFLDTSKLSDLAFVSRGLPLPNPSSDRTVKYQRVLEGLRNGALVPLAVFSMIGEWAKYGDTRKANGYADVLDGARSHLEAYGCDDGIIAEATNSISSQRPDLGLPRFDLLHPPDWDEPVRTFILRSDPASRQFMASALPGVPNVNPGPMTVRIRLNVARMIQSHHASVLEASIAADRQAFDDTANSIERVGLSALQSTESIHHWLEHSTQLGDVLRHYCPSVPVQDLVQLVQLDQCPGTMLYYHTYLRYVNANLNGRRHAPTDMVDLVTIPALAYADVALVDRRTAEYVRQARQVQGVPQVSVYSDVIALPDSFPNTGM